MKATYLGRKLNKNEFGDVINIYDPCVQVTLKNEYEMHKFSKMMDWIHENCFEYKYDVFGEIDNEYTAYVYVDDGTDAAEFMSYYKEAKKEVK